jgi:hypothetical protein
VVLKFFDRFFGILLFFKAERSADTIGSLEKAWGSRFWY